MMQEFSDRTRRDGARSSWRDRIIIAAAVGFGGFQVIWYFVSLFA